VGTFVSRDLIGGENVAIGTSAGFLPLFAGAASEKQAGVMAETLTRWEKAAPWIVPSTDPAHAAFEPLRYWRGPVWVVVNWMIANGFALAGRAKVADHILDRTVALIETSGLAEYFDPRTGHGLGGSDFSWTAAIYLMLSREG
jgi:glycogen debranching enzyme